MKEDKKAAYSKKPTGKKYDAKHASNNHKPYANKNNARNAKVVETKKKVVNEKKIEKDLDFSDVEEGENKKLIVVIAIAILVIVATIIGLLVGCNRAVEDEPKDKNNEDIVVPVEKDDEKEEGEANVVTPTKKVVKVVAKQEEKKPEVTKKYEISYFYKAEGEDFEAYVTNKDEGSNVSKYLPSGYENCSYYLDEGFTTVFDFSNKLSSDTKVYMVCELKKNTVTYLNADGTVITSEEVLGADNESYTVNAEVPETDAKFLGWSMNGDSVVACKNGETVNLTKDVTLTAVYGATTIVYKNVIVKPVEETPVEETVQEQVPETEAVPEETEVVSVEESEIVELENPNEVEIALTAEEVESYTLPETPEEVGLETPSYYVPTEGIPDGENNYRTIVSDELEEFDDTKEVKIGEVIENKPEWYDPQVNDTVEKKPYEFIGWTTPDSTEPVTEYTPSTEEDAENELDANYQIPVEDAVQEVEA